MVAVVIKFFVIAAIQDLKTSWFLSKDLNPGQSHNSRAIGNDLDNTDNAIWSNSAVKDIATSYSSWQCNERRASL